MDNMVAGFEEALRNSFISLGKWVLGGLIASSYWVCFFVSMFGVLFYVIGFKEGIKYTWGSILVYVIIRCLGAFMV